MKNLRNLLGVGVVIGVCCITTLLYGQATVQLESTFDLKSVQLVKIVDGKLTVTDVYTVKELTISNSSHLQFLVVQIRTVDNSQSCGTLYSRFVRLRISENRDAGVDISASKFGEFVAATNYYTKFRDNLETLQTGKRKIFEYVFGDDDKFVMMGDKNNVAMELSDKKEKANIFSTQDLKIINSFSDDINSVQKFLASHKF
jgi:hypothetical protein